VDSNGQTIWIAKIEKLPAPLLLQSDNGTREHKAA
jgi:hypothetical protein